MITRQELEHFIQGWKNVINVCYRGNKDATFIGMSILNKLEKDFLIDDETRTDAVKDRGNQID